MDVLSAGPLMLQAIARHVKDGEALDLLQTEAMELVAGLLEAGYAGKAGKRSPC